jgi:hypothetical protein
MEIHWLQDQLLKVLAFVKYEYFKLWYVMREPHWT